MTPRIEQQVVKGTIPWGSPIERQVRIRIVVSVAAYAYEIANSPLMGDYQWDWMAQQINPEMGTCHPLLDEFFAAHFSPMTGMWIHDHPELDKIAAIYERYYANVVQPLNLRVEHAGKSRQT